MDPQTLIKSLGSPAIRVRRTVASYSDFGDPLTYSADDIIGFRAIVDQRKFTEHRRIEAGDAEGIDLTILFYWDDTGDVADILPKRGDTFDIIHFKGVFDVVSVQEFDNPLTGNEKFFKAILRRRQHIRTTLTIDSLYAYANGGNFDIDLSLTADDGGDLTGETLYAEVLDSGSWDSEEIAFVSGSKWRFTPIAWTAGNYTLRIRYPGDDLRQGVIAYIGITVTA